MMSKYSSVSILPLEKPTRISSMNSTYDKRLSYTVLPKIKQIAMNPIESIESQ